MIHQDVIEIGNNSVEISEKFACLQSRLSLSTLFQDWKQKRLDTQIVSTISNLIFFVGIEEDPETKTMLWRRLT